MEQFVVTPPDPAQPRPNRATRRAAQKRAGRMPLGQRHAERRVRQIARRLQEEQDAPLHA